MLPPASFWIEKLQLSTHIEGGSYKEIYRSDLLIPQEQLPGSFDGARNISTSIYFLLEAGQFSAFHRISADEQWHFYYGGKLMVFEIQEDGHMIEHTLGNDPTQAGCHFQCIIKAGSWFASAPAKGTAYSLAGCTVAPGFDFADFELANRQELVERFPQHEQLIVSLTRMNS